MKNQTVNNQTVNNQTVNTPNGQMYLRLAIASAALFGGLLWGCVPLHAQVTGDSIGESGTRASTVHAPTVTAPRAYPLTNTKAETREESVGRNNPQEFGTDSRGSPGMAGRATGRLELEIPRDSKSLAPGRGEFLALYPAFFPAPGAISVSKAGAVVGWPRAGKPGMLLGTLPQSPDTVAICNAAALLAVADPQGVRILHLPDLAPRVQLAALKTRVVSAEFSPECDSLLLGGGDGMVYRWKFASWSNSLGYEDREKLLERYIAHASAVSALAFHPFGRIFFSGDWDGVLNAWLRYDSDAFGGQYDENLSSGTFFTSGGVQRMRASRGSGDDLLHLRISGDGQYLILATQAGILELWKVRGFNRLCQVQAHQGLIYDARFLPDESGVVTLGRDEQVREWKITREPDPAGGPDKFSFALSRKRQQSALRQVLPLPDGRILAGTVDGAVVEAPLEAVRAD